MPGDRSLEARTRKANTVSFKVHCDAAKAAIGRAHFATARSELQRALVLCDDMDPVKQAERAKQLQIGEKFREAAGG